MHWIMHAHASRLIKTSEIEKIEVGKIIVIALVNVILSRSIVN